MPGCWLKKGENEIIVFDIIGPKEVVCEGLKEPIIDKLNISKPQRKETVDFNNKKPIYNGSFKPGNGWQEISFNRIATGRYIGIETLNTHDRGTQAAISEFYLLNNHGERIPREQWAVVYTDSEDIEGGNHSAEKAFDLQESTYWSTKSSAPFPHSIVIDMGCEHSITALQYLPRMENGAPSSIKDFKIYVY